MTVKLKYIGRFRDWWMVAYAGVLGFAIALAAVEFIDMAVTRLHGLSILLPALAGAVVGMSLAGVWSALQVVQKLSAQNSRRRVALNNMVQGLCMFDGQQRLAVWNREYQTMYKFDAAAIWRGCSLHDLLMARAAAGTLPGDPDEYEAHVTAQIALGKTFTLDTELADGRVVAVVNRPTSEGGWVATHEDITIRRRAERELDRTRSFLDTVIENVPSPIIVKDYASLKYLLINRAAERFFGVSRETMLGKTAIEVMPKASIETIDAQDRKLAESGEAVFFEEHAIVTPGNGTRIATATRLPVMGPDGKPQIVINLVRDLTERKRHEQRIAHMAHHDQLTDLPNRAAFNECIEATVGMTAPGDKFAVLCIDLDRFKAVNDVFGHGVGDALLREVARRMEMTCQGAFLARIGGDEFTVITPTGPQPASAEALAARLSEAFESDITIESHSMRVGLTIGVAIFPRDGADAATLVANADAALFRAKSDARGSIRFFEMAMDAQLRDKRALQQDLRKAVEHNELELHYQPQASIDGAITGFEALARWHHPRRGLVPPCDFIPLAEESGIIGALGEWVLRTACREAASWPLPLHIAVNLSPVQFQHGDLPSLVHQVLLDTGLPPARLELEITEGVLIGDFTRAVAVLRRLKNLGVRIAMDDFGTGYSSLSYLQSFPFDSIKIDRAFIANLAHSQQSQTIARAVIALSRGLGVPVVAEGVETEEQRQFLADENCSAMQGYLIGRPKPIADYAEMVGRVAFGRKRKKPTIAIAS
jgi:diguanylate cyclase (GGDEF)-like protein/PAS domain S-box-containing protein